MSWNAIRATLLAVVLGTTALANVNGAIYTTVAGGTVVNANIYQSKADVFLSGGPQNHQSAGLAPEGDYYFQVTDPSGATLLSTDAITCRVVRVAGGRIVGVPVDDAGGFGTSDCYHTPGTFDASNGTLPVQLLPYLDTPNPGGEYKVWVTPVGAYATACAANQGNHGFCDAESKTDNFKVRSSAPDAAFISVCKFNDQNANGAQDEGEPLIPHWPITATGVDNGTVAAQTDDLGCVSFTFSGFTDVVTSQTVTLAEGTFGPDWTQTAPLSCGTTPDCAIADGRITVTVHPGDDIDAPNFGNTNPYCTGSCATNTLVLTATSFPKLTRTYTWGIEKAVDETRIATAAVSAVFNYTVTLTHDAGTDSGWQTTGSIRVSNPGGEPIAGLDIGGTVDNGGSCTVIDGTGLTVPSGSHIDLTYACAFGDLPAAGALSAVATWGTGTAAASAGIDFASAAISVVDGQVALTDTLAGDLGAVDVSDASPIVFAYAKTIDSVPGSCVTTNNTAAFVADTSGATASASQAVELCVGANLSVTKTASAEYASTITKRAGGTVIQQQGGSPVLDYTVTVAQSGWVVSGVIEVSNPNDWQAVTATVTDVIGGGGNCTVTGGESLVLPPSSIVTLPYTCTYAAAPLAAAGANVAHLAWDSAAASTPSAGSEATAGYTFAPLTVTDLFAGQLSTLGTVTAPAAVTTFSYSKTVANAAPAACRVYTNEAAVVGRDQQAAASVTVCNTTTGAHTIGFWQNKNGQAIIAAAPSLSGACSLTTWLRQFAPFGDLAATANCKTAASYATTVIKAASAGGAAMNAMLKAQMLATALDVYFSDATLGGNRLGAPVAVGGVRLDLAGRSAAFGGAAFLTVGEMLLFQNLVATAGGGLWYGNVKATQDLAKTAFDAINNQVAPIAH